MKRWSESGKKSAQIKQKLPKKQAKTAVGLDFDVRDNRRWTFSLDEALLWINNMDFSFCLLQMLSDGLEWCGLLVDYCDVFISCLDSHSDGTHSLQSIHCWDSDAVTHFSKSNFFLSFLHFWLNYCFKRGLQSH